MTFKFVYFKVLNAIKDTKSNTSLTKMIKNIVKRVVLISGIFCLFASFKFIYHKISLSNLEERTPQPQIDDHWPAEEKMEKNSGVPAPKVVIGILSNSDYRCLRDTQRAMFVREAKAYRPLDIKVYFLLDHSTPLLDKELEENHDIVYLNVTEHGWNDNFAKKLYNWYKYSIDHFPDALLIGRMDDDVFVCTPQIFERLNTVKNHLLYYGYRSTMNCLDDMFLFVGIDLVKRIAKRPMCTTNQTLVGKDCLQEGNAVLRLKEWISIYPDVVTVDERETKKMIHFMGRTRWGQADMKRMYKNSKHEFCKRYILFHKATPVYMYELHSNNLLLQNDTRMQLSEQEIRIIHNCNVTNF